MMNIKEFAQLLNKRMFRFTILSPEEKKIAKENGFVIVYGCSDDLMEFEGAFDDEADCVEGGKVFIDKEGVCNNGEETPNMIEGIYCEEKDEDGEIIPWTFQTTIPHETFLIYEDTNEIYSKAIVFHIKDIQ